MCKCTLSKVDEIMRKNLRYKVLELRNLHFSKGLFMRLHDKHFLYVHQIENHHDFFPTTLKRQFKKSLGNLFSFYGSCLAFSNTSKKYLSKFKMRRREENMDGWTVDKLWCCLPYFFYYTQKIWHRFDNKSTSQQKDTRWISILCVKFARCNGYLIW